MKTKASIEHRRRIANAMEALVRSETKDMVSTNVVNEDGTIHFSAQINVRCIRTNYSNLIMLLSKNCVGSYVRFNVSYKEDDNKDILYVIVFNAYLD